MTTYVIGDLHGCADELFRLLDKLHFDPKRDRLWLTGDLINRGPKSLETLRFIHSLGDSAVTVLGNHDMHLLGCWAGVRTPRSGDTVNDILKASDCDKLCNWLRQQPLMHRDRNHVLVHAGLYPGWDIESCEKHARTLEKLLAGDDYRDTLEIVFGGKAPSSDSKALSASERLRFTATVFTLMRFVDPSNMELDFKSNQSPEDNDSTTLPWYTVAEDRFAEFNVFSGHWAALGHRRLQWLTALDSGCVWGGGLTAVRRGNPEKSYYEGCSHLNSKPS